MSMNTVPERLAALRAAMAANGVAVYLIPVGDPHASEYLPCHYTSLTWFSGFHGENSNFVVTRTESALWADGRYFVQAEKEIAGTEIKLQRQLGVTTLYVTHDQTEALTMGDRIAVIKLGILQQVGAPTELYDRPANVFVAGFIGSPSMNINTHPVVNGKAKIGEDTVDLPTEAVNKLTAEDNGQIVVGFRPEDASLAAPDEANAFSLKVMNVEDLGSDGYIYGNIITDGSAAEASTMMSDQNKLTTIRVNPRALPKVGDTVKIKIDPSKMHLFAPSTELRLN